MFLNNDEHFTDLGVRITKTIEEDIIALTNVRGLFEF